MDDDREATIADAVLAIASAAEANGAALVGAAEALIETVRHIRQTYADAQTTPATVH